MFNIGNRVKVIGYESYNGHTGVVLRLHDRETIGYDCSIILDCNGLEAAFNFWELELIPEGVLVKIKRLSPDATVPTYATTGSACFDLVATEDILLQPGETRAVGTGLAFEIPEGYQMKIHPRSGISLKTPLRIANAPGCIDSDYRGEVKVLLWNTYQWYYSDPEYGYKRKENTVLLIDNTEQKTKEMHLCNTYRIRKGDRIAQAEIVPVIRAEFELVDELTETERGAGGFGSSGFSMS